MRFIYLMQSILLINTAFEICLGNKNAEAVKFLEILEKVVFL